MTMITTTIMKAAVVAVKAMAITTTVKKMAAAVAVAAALTNRIGHPQAIALRC
jgi:hypothetical protein